MILAAGSRLGAAMIASAVVLAACSSATRAPSREEPSRFAVVRGEGGADYRVHYRAIGSGEPAIVFVHGWSCDMTFWDDQAPHFAASHRVVLVDLPGQRRSDAPGGALSMDVFADAVDAVLRDAKIPRAVLVGHSMGTPVIRQFYRHHAEKTVALVAVDGALRPFSKDPKFAEGFLGPLRGDDYLPVFTKMVIGMTASVKDARKRARVRETMLATPHRVVVRAGEGMLDHRIWDDDPIGVPLLVVVAKSTGWPADFESYIRTLAPRARYVVMDDVSHFLMMDDPQRFNSLVDGFLANVPETTSR